MDNHNIDKDDVEAMQKVYEEEGIEGIYKRIRQHKFDEVWRRGLKKIAGTLLFFPLFVGAVVLLNNKINNDSQSRK